MTLSRRARDERGITLPEVLVAAIVSALVMAGLASAIYATTQLQRRTDDQTRFASALALVAFQFDRDASMATAAAPARAQVAAVACTTVMDIGLLEGGASVRYRTVASAVQGPSWLQRTSGVGTRTVAKSVNACTWRARRDGAGRFALELTVTLRGPSGETVTQLFRASPRLW